MAITLRTVKGSALTHGELDINFTDITSSMVHSGSISGTTLTLHRSSSNFDIDLSGLDTTVATGSLLVTGSVSNNVLTFTKGDGSTFNLTVDTGSGGGGLSDNFYTADGSITGNRTVTFSGFGNYVVTGSLGTFQVYTNEVLFPLIPDAGGTTVDILAIANNGRLFKTGSDAFSGGGTPGGADTQVQFNDGGSFGGDSGFTYNSTTDTVTIKSVNNSTPSLFIATTETTPALNDVLGEVEGYSTQYSTGLGGLQWVADGGWSGGDYPTRIDFQTIADGGTTISTKMSIKGSGRVGIGTTDPTNGFLEVNGNVSGTSIYASANIVAYSDARSKTNVTTITNALDKVDAIRGVTYNKVEDPDGIRYMGVIAQELQEVLPEVVAEGEDGRLAVAYGNIVGVLIEAVKELKAEIAELKANR